MSGKTDRYIVKPQILEQVVYHDMEKAKQEIGLPYRYMGSSLMPEADIDVGLQEIRQVPQDFEFIAIHKHDVSQFYGIIGELSVEVILDGEKHEVDGPASIFIPAGMMHSFRPLKGSGYVMVVLRKAEYG